MKGLIVGGDPDRSVHLLYGAPVELMRVGVGANGAEMYASIELHYSLEAQGTMLKIAREMERQRLAPQVSIKQEADIAYVVAVFRIPHAAVEFLRDAFPQLLVHNETRKQAALGKVEVIATGEAEFKAKEILPFLGLYREKGWYRLFIFEQQGTRRVPAWGVQLTSFGKDLPFPLSEA